LVFTITSAQQFLLEGEVVHHVPEELENIHIFNTTSSKGTLTDRNGKFKIAVAIGDTLHISALQFQAEKIPITLQHFVAKKITIALRYVTTELDEIFLKNHNLSGFLKRDAENIQTKPYVSAVTLGIQEREIRVLTQSERQLKTASYGAGPMSLDGIINGISGRTKMLKNRVKVDKENVQIEILLEKFPSHYLSEELKIEEDAVYDFLYFCEADPYFSEIIKKDRITILHFLKLKAATYLKLQTEE